jgi:hippurate hydrolase
MGGEDFGRYSRHLEVPGLQYRLGSIALETYAASQEEGGAPLPSLHSSQYFPDPEPTLETGITTMTHLALDLFQPTTPQHPRAEALGE